MAKIFSIFDTKIVPGADNTSDNGSSLLQWKDLYVKGVSYLTTLGQSMTFSDNLALTVGTGTGLKIGTTSTGKLGFYNATPITRPSGSIKLALSSLGLVNLPTYTHTFATTSTTYAVTTADDYLVCSSGTAFTVTLPLAIAGGREYLVVNVGTAEVTVAGNMSDTIAGDPSQTLLVNVSIRVFDYESGKWAII